MGLAHCKSTDCIAVKIQLTDPLGMFYPYVIENSSLIDTKQHLMRIDSIGKAV